MTEKKDVQPVEIIEPVELKEPLHRHLLNGYRWITIGYALLAIGVFLGLFFGFHNDQKLSNEIRTRCHVSEQSRTVLRDEHKAKLRLAEIRLHNTLEFGVSRPIPPGFTQKDITNAIRDARADIRIERELLRRVQPQPCPE